LEVTADKRTDWGEMEDSVLVIRAQAGEREAFGELVRRHRAKVYGYARSITQEPYLAEDVVQDALMRAFMHLGKLVDAQRFLPWMQRIVRNQAYTRLKARPTLQEQTFTELEGGGRLNGQDDGEWNDLDRILFRLNRTANEAAASANAPEEKLLQKETLHTLTDIIHCLKPRERMIFESHFFDQLSPQEIAKLFQLSSANVYQIISRSRKKVIQEKIRVTVDSYMKTRRDMGIMSKRILDYGKAFHETGTWTTAADVIYKMLQFTDRKLSLPMVMGLTGHAFRINIVPKTVHIAGPTGYNFSEVLPRGLHNIGFHAKVIDGMSPNIGENSNLLDPSLTGKDAMGKRSIHRELPRALDLIHRSLDQGIPVLAWDLFFPEFGTIYGYDDETRLLYAEECGKVETLQFDHLGRSVLEEIFVLAVDGKVDLTLKQQLRLALESAIEHYEGRESAIPANCVKGLAAYDTWLEALEGGVIEPNGHAYNIAVLRDARYYGAEFFKELKQVWPIEEKSEELTRHFDEASALYQGMYEKLDELHRMFPFPQGGQPNDSLTAREARGLVEGIKPLESKALECMKEILALIGD